MEVIVHENSRTCKFGSTFPCVLEWSQRSSSVNFTPLTQTLDTKVKILESQSNYHFHSDILLIEDNGFFGGPYKIAAKLTEIHVTF